MTLLSSHWKQRANLVLEQRPFLVGRNSLPGRRREYCLVHDGSLLAPLAGNENGSTRETSVGQRVNACQAIFTLSLNPEDAVPFMLLK